MIIRIDGTDIADRFESATVNLDWDAAHAEIEIQSKSASLWADSDPATGWGTARIEADWGSGITFQFLLESRDGEPESFTIRGRSLSALLTADFSDPVYVAISDISPATLANLAAAFSSEIVTWSIDEHDISDLYMFAGYPAAGLRALAEEYGGVVQPLPGGGAECLPRFPCAPGVLQSQPTDITADWTADILEFSVERRAGAKCDAIRITTPVSQESPKIEQESGEPVAGLDLAYIDIFWPEQEAVSIEYSSTDDDGTISPVSTENAKTVGDQVIFKDGAASVSYPVYSLDSVAWIGDDGGTPGFAVGDTTLRIATREIRIADIEYTTRYDRYSIDSSSGAVDTVLIVLWRQDSAMAQPHLISLSGEPGTNPAENIELQWNIGEGGRKARAEAELYAGYDVEAVALEVPATTGNPRPGQILEVTGSDYDAKYMITSATFQCGAIRETWEIQAERWIWGS